ncbi:MAG: serine/threonine-protein kinase, partial [Myxococcota bacterium]
MASGDTQSPSTAPGFAHARPMDDELFGPLEAQQLYAQVFQRVFGEPNPVRIGRYTVLERIGTGGMGVVYSAFDNELDRKVAVKLVRRQGNTAQSRMIREAKSLARLSHPNVVQVHDVGEWQGHMFIAMELVVGATLSQWLTEAPRAVAEITELLAGAGNGLVAAHAAGITHRDFKPDNILVGADGRARVVDFGVARTDAGADAGQPLAGAIQTELTVTGTAVGTPAYMAPEQLTGAALDSRVDQFAFAIVLYEAVTGQRPFAADDITMLRKEVCSGNMRPFPRRADIPGRVRIVIERALSPSPDDRYPSMEALLSELRPSRRPGYRGLLGAAAAIVAVSALSYGLVEDATSGAQAADTERRREASRADTAERALAERQDRLTVEEARVRLGDDTAAAVAKLAELSPSGWTRDARAVAAEAQALGIPTKIVRAPDDSGPATESRNGVFLQPHGTQTVIVHDVAHGTSASFSGATVQDTIFDKSANVIVSRDGATIAACCDGDELRIARVAQLDRPLTVPIDEKSARF